LSLCCNLWVTGRAGAFVASAVKGTFVERETAVAGDRTKPLRRPVVVEVTSSQRLFGKSQLCITETVEGTLFQERSSTFLLAYDMMLDGEKYTYTLKVSPGETSILKVGPIQSRQYFLAEAWSQGQYYLDDQTLTFQYYSRKLETFLEPHGGLLDLEYDVYAEKTHLGRHQLELFIE
jgi:uncharacterized beta-barrel protein YwiB (DUF1934 family)